jgi:hypothetical protein
MCEMSRHSIQALAWLLPAAVDSRSLAFSFCEKQILQHTSLVVLAHLSTSTGTFVPLVLPVVVESKHRPHCGGCCYRKRGLLLTKRLYLEVLSYARSFSELFTEFMCRYVVADM